MVTRQQMDTLGRVARNLVDRGEKDKALMAWVDGLDERDRVATWAWNDERLHLVRTGVQDERFVEHHVLWRHGPYALHQPEYRVTVDGVDHDFTTPLGAATFIVTGRDVTERPLTYEVTVREPGKQPDVEPFEVVGLDEAIDAFMGEVDLTAGRPIYVPRAEVRTVVRSGTTYTYTAKTPDGVQYIHTIGKV